MENVFFHVGITKSISANADDYIFEAYILVLHDFSARYTLLINR